MIDNVPILATTKRYITKKSETFNPEFKEKYKEEDFLTCVKALLWTIYDYIPIETAEDVDYYFNVLQEEFDKNNVNFLDLIVSKNIGGTKGYEVYKTYKEIPPEMTAQYLKIILDYFKNSSVIKRMICRNLRIDYS